MCAPTSVQAEQYNLNCQVIFSNDFRGHYQQNNVSGILSADVSLNPTISFEDKLGRLRMTVSIINHREILTLKAEVLKENREKVVSSDLNLTEVNHIALRLSGNFGTRMSSIDETTVFHARLAELSCHVRLL